jgi:hypothetical protein
MALDDLLYFAPQHIAREHERAHRSEKRDHQRKRESLAETEERTAGHRERPPRHGQQVRQQPQHEEERHADARDVLREFLHPLDHRISAPAGTRRCGIHE